MQTSLSLATSCEQTEIAKPALIAMEQRCASFSATHGSLYFAKNALLLMAFAVSMTGCRSALQQPSGQGNAWQQALEGGLTSQSMDDSKSHPLTQRLRPGARSPALRKSMADKRRLTRPAEALGNDADDFPAIEAYPEDSYSSEGYASENYLSEDEVEMLSDFAEPQQLESLSPREHIQREIRRRSQQRQFSDTEIVVDSEAEDVPEDLAAEERLTTRGSEGGFTIEFSDSPSAAKDQLADTDEFADAVVEVVPSSYAQREEPSSATANDERAAIVTPEVVAPLIGVGDALDRASQRSQDVSELDWTELGTALLERLDDEYANADSNQARIDIEKKKRLISVVLDDLGAAQTPIEGLRPEAQEYIRQTLQGLYDATSEGGHPSVTRKLTQALESHRRAMVELTSVANLKVDNLAFCTEVDSFGVIKEFENYQFQPVQEVLLYCELQNFASREMAGGYETCLQGSYEIIDTEGRQIFEQPLPKDTDKCASRRRDFYIAYRLYMPEEIKPGAYQLRLYIEDLHGRKFGQSEVDFRIGR